MEQHSPPYSLTNVYLNCKIRQKSVQTYWIHVEIQDCCLFMKTFTVLAIKQLSFQQLSFPYAASAILFKRFLIL